MGSSYSVEVAAMNAMMGFIVMIVFVCLVGVAAQVLLGLATYNDAKARGNNDPVMWGLLVGFVTPLPRSVLFGMLPMVPTALAMAFELAAYGALAGVCYSRWHGGVKGVYLSLLAALVGKSKDQN